MDNSKQEAELFEKVQDVGDRSQYHNLVDILFVLDATGSMSWCISQLKQTVHSIMEKFKTNQYNIKFAIELYRDHPPQEYSFVQKHFDLRNQTQILKVIETQCEVSGGGDTPEAVFDGLVCGLKKTSWRISTDGKTRSKRFLFHGCDAPPHGKQYGSTSSDAKWTQNGCPCGFTRNEVKTLLQENNVYYSLIKCGTAVDIMAGLFKECFSKRFKSELEIKKEDISPLTIFSGSKIVPTMSPPSIPKSTSLFSSVPSSHKSVPMSSGLMPQCTSMGSSSSRPIATTDSRTRTFNSLFGIGESRKKEQGPKMMIKEEMKEKNSKMASLVVAEIEKCISECD